MHHIMDALAGNTLQGIGTLILALMPILTGIYAYMNRHGINLWIGDRRALIGQINALLQANNMLLRENAGLLRASNAWDAASVAETWSRADAEALNAKVDRLQIRFNALISYTRDILVHNSALEKALADHAIPVPGSTPAVPDILRELDFEV